MADFGFGAEIGRDEDANRWALATPDVVEAPQYWVATPVVGERAVTMSPGRGQAAQITMPGSSEAVTPEERLDLAFTGSMTHQGKLIARRLDWYDIDATPPGESKFVVLNAGDFASSPASPPSLSNVPGLDRVPGFRYHVPLWFAVINQTTTEVRLWDLRVTDLSAPRVQVPVNGVLFGKVPAVGSQLRRVNGTASVTTNQFGDASWDYPVAFPNGVIYAAPPARIVDPTSGLGVTTQSPVKTQTLARLNFRVYQSSGAVLPNATLDFMFDVLGW